MSVTLFAGQPVPELPVVDVERAQSYYRDVFGFETGWVTEGKELGAVSCGGVVFFLRQKKLPIEPVMQWVFCEDVDATFDLAKAEGTKIVDPLELKPWGMRQFTVEDLDGNVFYFHAG